MMTPLVHVTLPALDRNTEESHFAPLTLMLEGLIKVNEWHIRRQMKKAMAGLGLPFPMLYDTGIYYQEDPPGQENWRDCFAILEHFAKTGKGVDCDQLVCWRVAELRCSGINAEPVIKWQNIPQATARRLYPTMPIGPDGLWMVHCCVRFPNGDIEDPSKLLGMGGNFTRHI